jgi:hypothetical protein
MFKLARIEPERQQAFDVLFNPTHYSVDKANQFAEAAVPGLEAPIIQYVHGNTRTLSIELFFDTYEERTDVSQHTERVYNLLLIDPGTHAPPICRITWGSFTFRGVPARPSTSLSRSTSRFACLYAHVPRVRPTTGPSSPSSSATRCRSSLIEPMATRGGGATSPTRINWKIPTRWCPELN